MVSLIKGRDCKEIMNMENSTLRRLIIAQVGLITSTGVVLAVLVRIFVVLGGSFLFVVAVVACYYLYYH